MARRKIEFPRELKAEVAELPIHIRKAIRGLVADLEAAQTEDGLFKGVITTPAGDGLHYYYHRGVFISCLVSADTITIADAGTYRDLWGQPHPPVM